MKTQRIKTQTIKYAVRKANRGRLWLETVEKEVDWSKGDNVIIYRPKAIMRGH